MANKIVTVPSHAQKRIYWSKDDKGKDHGHAFILVGYCDDTLAYFNALFQEAIKTFPSIDPANVTAGKVTKSSTVEGFTLIGFQIPGAKTTYPGWENYDRQVDFNF